MITEVPGAGRELPPTVLTLSTERSVGVFTTLQANRSDRCRYNRVVQDDREGRPDVQVAAGGWAVCAAFGDVAVASGAVLEQLREELGFAWWAVTRITGGTHVVLATGDTGFPLPAGEQMPWIESLCHRVLEQRAPRVVPDLRSVPPLDAGCLAGEWQIGAYLSVPLSLTGTDLFGTLCAVHPEPVPAQVTARLPLVELQARLLATVLAAELQLDEARRRAERAEADALLDPLTGLVNRRGWQMVLEREEQRCRRYGTVASVLVIDLDGLKTVNDTRGHAAGDALLQHAAQVLREAFRSTDVAARLGGNEFGVLAVETDAHGARHERDRLQSLFDRAAVPASIGVATRHPVTGLAGAWTDADAHMYRVKHAKPARLSPEPPPA